MFIHYSFEDLFKTFQKLYNNVYRDNILYIQLSHEFIYIDAETKVPNVTS